MSNKTPHYFQSSWIKHSSETLKVEVCVYGGTAAGVTAALEAKNRGRSVVLLNPARRVGGMTTGGLGLTDFGKQEVVGGMSRKFYDQVCTHYQKNTWMFEPHVAQNILDGWIKEAALDVRHCEYIKDAVVENKRIQSVTMLSGLKVHADVFIDTTYEGDLMAKANVPFLVGREDNDTFGETLNGSQTLEKHQFDPPIDPYVTPGDPSSGLLPDIESTPGDPNGTGDNRIQAYCFRVCMTENPAILFPFPKPEGYDEKNYEIHIRWYNSQKSQYNESLREDSIDGQPNGQQKICKFDRLAEPSKTDTNNHGPASSDYIGQNFQWPHASYEEREAIYQKHVQYQQGFYYTMANNPRIPERYRAVYKRWGLAADEFTDTNHWPEQLYVREARRMVGEYVLTENDCMHKVTCKDPVGMGSYAMDSHNCRRFVKDGKLYNEGDVQVRAKGPYSVSYRSIVPGKGQCENLLVPVCLSASHIAYGSIRMEPVFMVLGQSAAIAADLAMKGQQPVQAVPYETLQKELVAAGQVLRTGLDGIPES